MRVLLSHPVTKIVLASLLTGAMAWAGADGVAVRKHQVQQVRCDSTVAAIVLERDTQRSRADSLQRVIELRDLAYLRHVAQANSRADAVQHGRATGDRSWLVAAGSFVLGGVVGYLIGDRPERDVVAIATATVTHAHGGGHHKRKGGRNHKCPR